MAEEAEIVVKLDTEKAKASLANLLHSMGSTVGRVGGNIRHAVGKGLDTVGLGGGVGQAAGVIRGATEGGVSDIISEAFSPMAAQMEHFFLGSLGQEARASMAARAQTQEVFGYTAGQKGSIPQGAKSYFDQIRTIKQTEEHGKALFEQSSQFAGPGPKEIIDRILAGLKKIFDDAVSSLADKLVSSFIPGGR